MNVKMVVVARAGVMRGRMTRRKILGWPAPSILAASSSSRGMPRMNWTMRNTKNASVASSLGTMRGANVFTQPSCENRMYCGTMITWIGSMIVMSIAPKNHFLPQNSSLANAYAAIEHETRLPTIDPRTTMVEFSRYVPNGEVRAFQPLA